MSIAASLITFLGLLGGNFLWQAISGGDLAIAAERSFFQGVAIVCVFVVSNIQG